MVFVPKRLQCLVNKNRHLDSNERINLNYDLDIIQTLSIIEAHKNTKRNIHLWAGFTVSHTSVGFNGFTEFLNFAIS